MRIIAGLPFAASGSFGLFGKSTLNEVQKARMRAEFIIEMPPLIQPLYSVRDNMTMMRIVRGIPNCAISLLA